MPLPSARVSEARLRRFVADASHELRTPVTTIRGYAELYRHGGLAQPADLDQAMRRTEQESVRMASLVDDLLLLAHLDEGRPLARTSVDLGVLGVDAAADARAVAPDRVITAEVVEDVTVEGDENRLRQVVGNLVGNALVHTPAGTPVSVRVRNGGDPCRRRGARRRTGHGARDRQPRLRALLPRRRLTVAATPAAPGSALPSCRRSWSRTVGASRSASAPETGTTVTVELPRVVNT